jgi:hypothetical protein
MEQVVDMDKQLLLFLKQVRACMHVFLIHVVSRVESMCKLACARKICLPAAALADAGGGGGRTRDTLRRRCIRWRTYRQGTRW